MSVGSRGIPGTEKSSINPPMCSYRQTIEYVEKWSFRYHGGKDTLDFIEHIEELADMYNIDVNLIPRTMPLLLEGEALEWFRNNNCRWSLWTRFKFDFLSFFISARYLENLQDDVISRHQKPNENFKTYLIDIKNLMRRACTNPDSQLERIYQNMSPDYRIFIRRRDFSSLEQLKILADDFEELRREQHKVNRGGIRGETMGRCIVVESPETMSLQNTMRCIPTTPIRNKLIQHHKSELPILNKQQNRPAAKQTTAVRTRITSPSTELLPKPSIITQQKQRKNYLEQMSCKCLVPSQDPGPSKETPEVCDLHQQELIQMQEIQQVQIEEIQRKQNPKPVNKTPEIPKQQSVRQDPRVLPVQQHVEQLQHERQRETPNKRNLERINLVQVIQDKPTFQIPPPQRLQHVTTTEEYTQVQEAHSQRNPPLQEEQLRRPSTKLVRTSLLSIPQDQVHSETSLIPRQEMPVKQSDQCQQEIKVIENKTTQHRMTHKTPSPIQESQQVSHQGKDNSTQLREKVNIPMMQIKEQCLGSWNSSSNRTQQKQMESQGELQQSDHDYINTHQDKFYKVFKSSKKRNRNHSSR
ncbi:putative mediator of RNA polymerase II transcription subunit 26 [Teleopsis dalmanni]|uniref:putative mediator of RNA polymerase II transcription subunit 26 n=1 Tax=Teleopsis dalmanni TaxID=139649 RepID=UPI0018CFCBA1|nr:putative mediator of RNA polymerase II transcription subunit 26 [Teleopsis dalmanni]XP_037942568.1 putative mediator of RNA polymerase II transcription subunit 26 [Teleopsis dalmanni]